MERPPPDNIVVPLVSAKTNQLFSQKAPTSEYSAAEPNTGFTCGSVEPQPVVIDAIPVSSLSRDQEMEYQGVASMTVMRSPEVNEDFISIDRHLILEKSKTQTPQRKRPYNTMSQEQDISNRSQQIPTIEKTDASSLSLCKTLLNQAKCLLPEEINVLWNHSRLGTISPDVLLDTVIVFLKRLVGSTIDQDYSEIKLSQFTFLEEADGLTCVVLTERAPMEGNEGVKRMLVEKTVRSTERSDVRKSFTAVYNFYKTTR